MKHPRAHIRDAIAARLADYRVAPVPPSDDAPGSPGERWTMAEGRVYASRARNLDERDLPAVLIYARREKVAADSYPRSGENGSTTRTLEIAVEAVVRALDDVDDTLDAFALQVEGALEWLEIPGLETATIHLTDTDIDVSTDGRLPIGAVRLSFAVEYRAPYRTVPPVCEPPSEIWERFTVGGAPVTDYERVV